MSKGFTLLELVVVLAVTTVLSMVVLFSVNQYVFKGKDSNVSASLAVLIPAGEVYYSASNNSYAGFCTSDIAMNTKNQMPENSPSLCYDSSSNPSGVCCKEEGDSAQAWAACAPKFTDTSKAYCVDSRGVKRDINTTLCVSSLTQCP